MVDDNSGKWSLSSNDAELERLIAETMSLEAREDERNEDFVTACVENGRLRTKVAEMEAERDKIKRDFDDYLEAECRLWKVAYNKGEPRIATSARIALAIMDADKRVAEMEAALRRACTPPWPEWTDASAVNVEALMRFHLRLAEQAGGE